MASGSSKVTEHGTTGYKIEGVTQLPNVTILTVPIAFSFEIIKKCLGSYLSPNTL